MANKMTSVEVGHDQLTHRHTHTLLIHKHTDILLEGIKIIEEDWLIHLEVDPTEPWIFLLGKNTQGQ